MFARSPRFCFASSNIPSEKSDKIAVIPLGLMALLCIFVPAAISQTSLLMIPAGGLALLIGFVLFKKDKL